MATITHLRQRGKTFICKAHVKGTGPIGPKPLAHLNQVARRLAET